MKKRVLSSYLLLALVVPIAAAAQEWSQTVEIEYAIGDGEARTSARQAALTELKRKAANAAGTYVQSTTTLLETGELMESVEMLGASMVRLSDVQESLAVEGDDRLVLRVSARASIDESTLRERVKALHADAEKAQRIAALREHNAGLRRELLQIRKELAGRLSAARAAELLERQSTAFEMLAESERKVVAVFERGTLLDMLDASIADMERRIEIVGPAYERLIRGAHVTAKINRVQEDPKNRDKVLVDVLAKALFSKAEAQTFAEATKGQLSVSIQNRYEPSPWAATFIGSKLRRGEREQGLAVFSCLEVMDAQVIYRLGSASVAKPLLQKIRNSSDSYAYTLRGVGEWGMSASRSPKLIGAQHIRMVVPKAEAANLSEVSAELTVKAWRTCL